MKTRLIVIFILLLILTVLLTRNDDRIANALLNIINPVKQNYKSFTQDIEDKSHSYIFQKESIEKLTKENRILRKRLLEQMHYLEQVTNIYDILPELSRMPVSNISITETISYVKLNSFSRIILTKPKGMIEGKLYGLIQGTVVAGTAEVKNNQLYGYLTSDDKCRFSVFIGDKKAPGIAIGLEKNKMIIKFIPKWHNVQVGDKVITSGLDNIFFAKVPVGVVTSVEVQSAYTVAHINTYSNIFHPRTFFLVNDSRATLAEGFDSKSTKFAINCPKKNIVDNNESNNSLEKENANASVPDLNMTLPIISSIPSRIDQTQAEVIEPSEPVEHIVPVVHKKPKKKTQKKKKSHKKKKEVSKSLDLF
jgi:rod shape-determining protein MreC